MEKRKNVGIAGPKILYYDKPNIIWSAGGKINFLMIASHIGMNCNKNSFNSEYYVDYITGCCFLAKAKLFKEIGLLDEDYFLYSEEADFCIKAGRKGYRTLYVSTSVLYHKVARSTNFSENYYYHYVRSHILLVRKNTPFLSLYLIIIFLCLYFLIAVKFAILNKLEATRGIVRGLSEVLIFKFPT